MASENHDSLTFTVTMHEPVLVCPSEPTPHDYKRLSDNDDQDSLQFNVPMIQFYACDPSMAWRDPVLTIREGLAKALVYYYPFAGRLRQFPERKLVVECTGEGVMFIEADADVTLKQFGDALQPPFPCFEKLLFDVPGTDGILDSPLMLIQVTRLRCGGFIFALRWNHGMCDSLGLIQFLNAVGEMGQGAAAPSVLPVWQRELLDARNPPRVTCTTREYEEVTHTKGILIPHDDMIHRSFFFGSSEFAVLRRSIPHHLRRSSTFEILTACLWRCRTIALAPDPEEEMRMICIVNTRTKFNPPLPKGFYGNALAFAVAIATAGKLCTNPFSYALELIKEGKASVTEENMKLVSDLAVTKGIPRFVLLRNFILSDVTRVGFGEVDFGWGKPKFGGLAKGGVGVIPWVTSFCISVKNRKGEDGIVVPICLPETVMDRFEGEIDAMLGVKGKGDPSNKSNWVLSAL